MTNQPATNPADDRTICFLGNNVIRVLVSGPEIGGAYCVLEEIAQPGGGGNALHTDPFLETRYVLEGAVEFTVEREGQLETWVAGPGETISVPPGAKHRFVGAGDGPCRMLLIARPEMEAFVRALAAAWPGPYDRAETPKVVGPLFSQFGVHFCKQ